MAKWFELAVAADARFEVVVPRNLSLVCFRLRHRLGEGPEDDDAVEELNRRLLVAVNASGRAFMTHFVVDGKFVIRLAVGGAMQRCATSGTRGSCSRRRLMNWLGAHER
jgi:tyrosine decarboxylase